ncbi:MAG TPA: DNA mismatch repair protein MutS [Polyangiaceae bacterium]|nr:DNA mismatch repair protein MutS [Polyangiaceae bacterium]
MTDSPSADAPRRGSTALYDARAARHRADAEALGRRSRLVSNLRGLAFGVAAVCSLTATLGHHGPSGPAAVAGFVAFVGLVIWHARVIRAEDAALRALRVNVDAAARTTLAWRELAADGARFSGTDHPYASDLDLFGRGSVYQRLSVAHTRFGEDALARFLTEPAPVSVVHARQEAARALAPRLDDRQALEALAIAVVEATAESPGNRAPWKSRKKEGPPDPEPLLAWAEGDTWLAKRPVLVGLAYVLPPLTLLALSLGSTLHLPSGAWLVPFVASVLVVAQTREHADRVFSAVSATEGAFLRFGPMFERIETLEHSSELLDAIRRDLLASGEPPSRAMKTFERAVGWFELKHNGMLHVLANLFLLWDVHCVRMLEAWQERSGKNVRGWFRALGEVEALSSFAGLAFDEPSFAWPELVETPCFEAVGLGHLLLPPSARVSNDVSLPEAGRALLITGSNMSGKSTLLRSMGLAAVLAFAGAPVPASRLRLSPLAVRTSIRISDSLAAGVSHFYAEVARLKAVVDATAGSVPVFFLLDEILHGTNSHERQVGARWVLAELIRKGALGAVSTHDQGLCELPEPLMSRVVQCHFRESVAEDRMTFDYRLRPGPVSGGNALRLMRLVGLDVPLEGPPA